ncbi:hypothetical protein [Streptomyces coeruleorubidus]|uniref:Uncharacterized protein n=1 Tax=Streptomyces coeruleorubidus TaxID=116188 RepID=A0A5J6HZU7_STRC4|nr:hypothetical protein [Streptomyces coeruleorubidus]QEV23923.1 hypothetical protein CP976_07045 [Streptomyces coeruleorubidus]GGT86091.1 hypothetical protein GCM10010256_52840 [Streptomyces coeruleorubidus]
MERQQILDLYEWSPGVCFRHPDRGAVSTIVVKTLHPRGDGRHEIRACEDCVIAMEDIRREDAARRGSEYEPGHVGECEE